MESQAAPNLAEAVESLMAAAGALKAIPNLSPTIEKALYLLETAHEAAACARHLLCRAPHADDERGLAELKSAHQTVFDAAVALMRAAARAREPADLAFRPLDLPALTQEPLERGSRRSGSELMYNGATGEWAEAEVYAGPAAERPGAAGRGPAAAERPPIGIRGKKGAGKDTLAAEICACFPEYSARKWATRLRAAAASIAEIPVEQTLSEADKAVDLSGRLYERGRLLGRITLAVLDVASGREVPSEVVTGTFEILTGYKLLDTPETVTIPMTVGRLLQLLGTECFRDLFSPNVWVEALMLPWDAAGRPPIVVADTRFPNESAALRGAGGVVVLVRRAGATLADGRADARASECALDGEPADFVFENEGSVAGLRAAFLAAWPAILALAASRQ